MPKVCLDQSHALCLNREFTKSRIGHDKLRRQLPDLARTLADLGELVGSGVEDPAQILITAAAIRPCSGSFGNRLLSNRRARAAWFAGCDGKGTYLRVPLALPVGVLVPPVIGLLLGISLPHMPELLRATPQAWLIGFMVIRLVGGAFLVAWASGEVERPWFNVWAGSLDVFVGATALPVAWLVASGSPSAMLIAVGWNLVGLVDFLIAIAISNVVANAGPRYMLSLKGPVMNALRPTILGIVTFGVPLAIVIHLVSLWQLLTT